MDSTLFGFFFLNIFLSGIVAYVAQTKRRSPWAFFLLSFFLSFLVGIIVVLAIAPGNRARKGEVLAKCPFCKEEINALATVCKHCGKDVEPQNALIEDAEDAKRDTARGTKMIIGILLTILGLVFLIPNVISGFQGIGINGWWFVGLFFALGLVASGILYIAIAVKSARTAGR